MFYFITLCLYLLLYVHQISGGFFRFNDPKRMTAPVDLEDLDPGTYDELVKYNPRLAASYRDIRYGGDPNKPFDWSAPEIGAQEVELVKDPNESMYKDETGLAEEDRDENIFPGINRDDATKITEEIRDEAYTIVEENTDNTDLPAEKNRYETMKIAEKNRDEMDIIQEKMTEKIRKKNSSLEFLAGWPVWLGNNIQEDKTNLKEDNPWEYLVNNKTSTNKPESRFQAEIKDLARTRPQENKTEERKLEKIKNSNKNILRKRVRPKQRSYRVHTPWNQRTIHDHHIKDFANKDTHDYYLTGTYTTSCYRCGELKYGKWWRPSVELRERYLRRIIPTSRLCYEAFEGDDWTFKTKARYLRSRCYNNEKQNWKYEIGDDNYNYYHECVSPKVYPWLVNRTYDYGNPMECFGRYTGKCFKRFLDVGKVYTERGCASWPPHESNTFAGHRFTKMEFLLYKKDNGCVSSPIASITPFDRGVSLYVRYHVCVCTGKWCNAAKRFSVLPTLFTLSLLTIICSSFGFL